MSVNPVVQKRALPIIRVFVSSTFSDLKHERNALHAKVWPELERYCQQRGFTFQAIDLRWGVPAEAGLDHRTMRICFEEGLPSDLKKYLLNDSRLPFVGYGPSGSGKSALLARAFQDVPEEPHSIVRFIGATPKSADLRSLLTNFCQEFRKRFPLGSQVFADIRELIEENWQGLDPLLPQEARSLLFDRRLPAAGRTLDELPERKQKIEEHLRLNADDQGGADESFLHPLYLKLLFEEVRHWRSYDTDFELPKAVPPRAEARRKRNFWKSPDSSAKTTRNLLTGRGLLTCSPTSTFWNRKPRRQNAF